jgi:hypothetical protein
VQQAIPPDSIIPFPEVQEKGVGWQAHALPALGHLADAVDVLVAGPAPPEGILRCGQQARGLSVAQQPVGFCSAPEVLAT